MIHSRSMTDGCSRLGIQVWKVKNGQTKYAVNYTSRGEAMQVVEASFVQLLDLCIEEFVFTKVNCARGENI